MTERKIKIGLLVLLLIQLCLFCINPIYPNEIFMQHIATIIIIGFLVYATIKDNISNKAFLCLILMTAIHIVGARWNYSDTPYDKWFQSVLGFSINDYFGFKRNHFDRFVHFMYGFLLVIPVGEIYNRGIDLPKRLSNHVAFLFVLASSMIYELIEWMVAVFMSPAYAEAYNGQQGDFWDAQKDMALASLGAVVMIVIIRFANKKLRQSSVLASKNSDCKE